MQTCTWFLASSARAWGVRLGQSARSGTLQATSANSGARTPRRSWRRRDAPTGARSGAPGLTTHSFVCRRRCVL
eukprot:3486602-Prymnesium_polylepis.1